MSIEARIEKLEATRKPAVDLPALTRRIERARRKLSPERAQEEIRHIMRTLPDEALLAIIGLGDNRTHAQLMAVAEGKANA